MVENENKAKDIIRNGKGSIPFLRTMFQSGGSGEKVSEFFSNSRFSTKTFLEISKIPKQIVLFFETNFKLAKITILGCIEPLLDRVVLLSKEGKNSFKSLPLYSEVDDFIRDLAKLDKLVRTPYHITKHLVRLR